MTDKDIKERLEMEIFKSLLSIAIEKILEWLF